MGKERHLYEFGAFRVDADRRLLLREGEVVPLTPRAFDVLLVLVEHHGQLLQKEELLKAVWPDTFVEEANLSFNISLIRKALGHSENTKNPFIETLPKRGYRFVAPVRTVAEKKAGQVDGHKSPHSRKREHESRDTIEAGSGDSLATAPRWSWKPIMTAAAISTALFMLILAISDRWISSKFRKTGTSDSVQSIAVLPFKPLDAASRDESFEMGMADTLITQLSGMKAILVRPISAVRKYTGIEQDAVSAGRELNVDTVLDGSLQRSDERIRVSVRVVRVADGLQLWAGQFDENLRDIFAVQDAIAEKVVRALTIELTREDKRVFAKRYTEDTEAYLAYARGRYHWSKHTEDGATKSIGYYQQAIDKDANYALPYAGLADAYTLLGLYYLPPKEAFPKAKAFAEQALKLDGTLAAAHAALGAIVFYHEWDWRAAQKEVTRARELDPSYVSVYSCYLHLKGAFGQPDEAVAEIRQILDREPLSLFINAELGCASYYAHQYDRSIAQMRYTLEMAPDYAKARHNLARAYGQKGMYREAIDELIRARTLSGGASHMVTELAYLYARSGNTGEARKLLGELKREATRKYVSPYLIAFVHVALGEKDRALELLEKAYDDRSHWILWLKVEPKFDDLRSDPRFTELIRRVGLPQ